MRRPCSGHATSSALLLLVTASAPVLLTSAPALAHTSLVSSTPLDGATVAGEVGVVRLEFNQPVSVRQAQVVVTAPDGEDLADGPAQVSGATVSQPVGPATTSGSYRVAYRVLAEDGHPVTGELPFRVEPPAATSSPAAVPSAPAASAPPASASTAPGATGARAVAPTAGSEGGWAPGVAAGLGGVSVVLVAGAVRAGRRTGARR